MSLRISAAEARAQKEVEALGGRVTEGKCGEILDKHIQQALTMAPAQGARMDLKGRSA